IYGNTKMRIRIGGDTSSGYSYRKGVRQGCPCSPMLFNLFINDIFDGVTGLSVPRSNIRLPGLMFADDIVVFGNDIADLSHKVSRISRWAVENRMKINCGKSGVLVWGTDNGNESDRITISTDFGRIGEVTEYRYLGVLVKRTTLEEHLVRDGASRGKKALEVLKPKLLNKGINIIFKGILIKNVLVPALMYGSELWGMSSTRSGRITRI
ncbi:rna-directed dna polymerase from mobile element jockey-like protein, partial [Vairimorpha ceranae]